MAEAGPSPTAEEWIEAFANAAGVDPPSAEQVRGLLELASVAAHSSERRAAPIACWIAAAAELPPEEACRIAEGIAPSGD
ncbi:MAG: hypothetical protein KDB58_10425 [Solirubrobacterales bacterium]|nr:hypothetical protein [Solirubrobacterales bacterium]MCB8970568.1 hypothetical protein [Thermoleophilales bacterium]MCO5325729.1 DUF6457 domain-containing protein [Solirubrobacterales bacterium]